jgi:hypothetical protein
MRDAQHGRPRRRMAVTTLLAAGLLMLAAGCSGQATSATGPTSAATGTVTASLRVVSCPTTLAIAATPTPVALPSSRSVAIPAATAAGLAVYADTQGIMALVGPKGWNCAAAYGADGSGGVVIYPPGMPKPQLATSVWKLGQTMAKGIYGTESSACYSCTLAQACPLFAAAAKTFRSYLGHACVTRPAAEIVTPISIGIVSFEDPPGVHGDGMPSGGHYPANAVMTYHPNAPDGSWLETCTLPDSDKAECTAALNAFIAWYGAK